MKATPTYVLAAATLMGCQAQPGPGIRGAEVESASSAASLPYSASVPASQAGPAARIDSILQAEAAQGMSAVLRMESRDSVLLHRAYGMRDREAGEPLRIDHGFDIGSLVKPITAVAVLRAQEEGLLATTDTVGAYLPEAPPGKRGITIDQLLTHSGGLDDVFGGDYELVSRAEAIDRILGARLRFPPGDTTIYSNSGYTLLAILLEEATGEAYEAYVRRAVLEPAGAQGIGYVLAGWQNVDLAVGYRANGERWGTPMDQPWLDDGVSWTFRGAGGMLGTAAQMAAWYEGLIDGAVLEPDALRDYYAIGAVESGTVSGLVMAHAGGNGIFNTLQISWLEPDVHMTLFTSTASPYNAETVWRLIRPHVLDVVTEAHDP